MLGHWFRFYSFVASVGPLHGAHSKMGNVIFGPSSHLNYFFSLFLSHVSLNCFSAWVSFSQPQPISQFSAETFLFLTWASTAILTLTFGTFRSPSHLRLHYSLSLSLSLSVTASNLFLIYVPPFLPSCAWPLNLVRKQLTNKTITQSS